MDVLGILKGYKDEYLVIEKIEDAILNNKNYISSKFISEIKECSSYNTESKIHDLLLGSVELYLKEKDFSFDIDFDYFEQELHIYSYGVLLFKVNVDEISYSKIEDLDVAINSVEGKLKKYCRDIEDLNVKVENLIDLKENYSEYRNSDSLEDREKVLRYKNKSFLNKSLSGYKKMITIYENQKDNCIFRLKYLSFIKKYISKPIDYISKELNDNGFTLSGLEKVTLYKLNTINQSKMTSRTRNYLKEVLSKIKDEDKVLEEIKVFLEL